jgi:hypothetical protein
MEDYRTWHATPEQISSLWHVIGSLRQQVEELTERLRRVEAGETAASLGAEPASAPAVAGNRTR